jgi:hypothetical protein
VAGREVGIAGASLRPVSAETPASTTAPTFMCAAWGTKLGPEFEQQIGTVGNVCYRFLLRHAQRRGPRRPRGRLILALSLAPMESSCHRCAIGCHRANTGRT